MDQGRWIAITRPRTRRYPDLISVVRLGSGGPGRLGAVRRRGLAGTEVPRRHVGKSSPDLAKTATPGSIRPELGSGSFVTPCVIHLTRHLGTAGPGARKWLRRRLWAPETRRRRVLRGSRARVLVQKGQGVCARCGQTGSGVVRCCGVLQSRHGGATAAGRRRVAPGQRSGLRPKRLSAKGSSGIQGAHRGFAVD